MNKPPKGILFDLDDTIISLEASADKLWEDVSAEFSKKVDSVEFDSLLSAINSSRMWYWRDPDRHARGRHSLGDTRREIVRMAFSEIGLSKFVDQADELADTFTERRLEKLEYFPNAEHTLKAISQSEVKLGLITNGHAEGQREKVSKFQLERFFECILIEGEVGIAKPDPGIFRSALNWLGLSAEEVWMVGDNLEWDVAGAQSVGIFGIWNDFRREGLPSNTSVRPDRIIYEISELIETHPFKQLFSKS